MSYKKFGGFSSSENPEKFSKAWQAFIEILGVIGSAAAVIPSIAKFIPPGELQDVIQALTVFGTAVVTIYKSSDLVFGTVRRVIARINE